LRCLAPLVWSQRQRKPQSKGAGTIGRDKPKKPGKAESRDIIREEDIRTGFLENTLLWGLGVLTWVLLLRGEAITLDSLIAEGHRRREGMPRKLSDISTQAHVDQERVGVAVATLEDMRAGRPIRIGLSMTPDPGSNSPTQ
jgi:hypothetical protein